MPFQRFVEIGRVALINYGADYGKLVVIVDVIDVNRALVDAPGITRQAYPLRRLALTDIKLDISRIPKKSALIKVIEDADMYAKFNGSSWGKKIAVQKARSELTDFDRFKLMVARVKKSAILKREVAKLKKSA